MWDWLTGGEETTKEAVKFLTEYADYLQFQDLFSWLWNSFVWGVIKTLYALNTGLEKLLLQSFDVGDFLKDQGLTELQTTFATTLGAVLLLISLVWIGLKMIVGKNPPKLKDTLVMLVTAVFILLFSGTIVNTLFDYSKSAFQDITQINKNAPSIQIIQDNTSDLITVLTKKKESIQPTDKLNVITEKNIWYTDINAVITSEAKILKQIKEKTNNKEAIHLDKKLTVNDKGETTAVSYKDGLLARAVYESGYRRYATNNGVIFFGEGSLSVGYVFILFSIVMCIFELMYKKFILLVATASDLETGQRRNKAMESVAQSALLIAFTGLELRIYLEIIGFLGNKQLDATLYVICLVVSTFLLFKGSQSVTAIFGVDTSLKNGGRSLVAALGAAGVARGVGNGAKQMAGSTVSVAKKGINSIRNKPMETRSTEGSARKEKAGLGDRAKELAKTSGKLRGYLDERKLSGATKDGAEAVKDKAKTVAKAAKDGVKQPIDTAKAFGKALKEDYDTGVDEGITAGVKKQVEGKDSLSEEDLSIPRTEGVTQNTRGTNEDLPNNHKETAPFPKRETSSSVSFSEPTIPSREKPERTNEKRSDRQAKRLNGAVSVGSKEKNVPILPKREGPLHLTKGKIRSSDSAVMHDPLPIETARDKRNRIRRQMEADGALTNGASSVEKRGVEPASIPPKPKSPLSSNGQEPPKTR